MLIISECNSKFLYRVFLSSVAFKIEDSINDWISAAICTCEEIQDFLQQVVRAVLELLVDKMPKKFEKEKLIIDNIFRVKWLMDVEM